MNRSLVLGFALGCVVTTAVTALCGGGPRSTVVAPPQAVSETRVYDNTLMPIKDAKPLLADFPQYVEPVVESRRFEAPRLVDDPGADLDVRAWRWSYNARGIIEMPNHLRAAETALIMVHPWGIDDGQGSLALLVLDAR